jgi:hypothetical protein
MTGEFKNFEKEMSHEKENDMLKKLGLMTSLKVYITTRSVS